MNKPTGAFTILIALGLLLAACGDSGSGGVSEVGSGDSDSASASASGTATTQGDACAMENLTLINDGVLTIGTDDPAFPPWFDFEDPASGIGYESAVAAAIAEQLGFSDDQVEWVVVPFNNSFAPGAKDFDFDINQISISEERSEVIDFSDGYYDVRQSLVALEGSPAIGAETIADLKDVKLGAQIGTTSLIYIDDVIQPDSAAQVYDTNNDAKAALEAGQVDALVFDLPTAFYITAVEIEGSSVIGQFDEVGDTPEQFGLVFEKGSPLVDCVNTALETLREDGTLADLEQEFLSDATDAPVIGS